MLTALPTAAQKGASDQGDFAVTYFGALRHIVLYENEKSTTAKRKMDQFPAASQGCLYGSAARDTYRQL